MKKEEKKAKKLTPLMQQYQKIKGNHPHALLLFRVGDFYETFGDDAIKTASILHIVLTKRGNGSDQETALAGFPHHALPTYLPKLVKAGERVAICDQLEDPKQTKTIVKRGVTELITPGVALHDEVLQSKSNNFLAALHYDKKSIGLSFLDVSTGEFLTSQGDLSHADALIQKFNPSEILISKSKKNQFSQDFGSDHHVFHLEPWIFKYDYTKDALYQHFGTTSLKGFGIEDLTEGVIASGAILHYLSETQHHKLPHITTIQRIAPDAHVWMDRFTIRNLELYPKSSPQSIGLLDVIDQTLSPMGGRTLKRWMAFPLKNKEAIHKRHEVVQFLLKNAATLQAIRDQLKKTGDIERLVTKVATAKISPREVIQLKNALESIIPIKSKTKHSKNEALKTFGDTLHDCDLFRDKIKQMLTEDAPVNLLKGNTIATGYSESLDTLRALVHSNKAQVDAMVERESKSTGIPSLKISSNHVFGYYIEVRNLHKGKVPSSWVRKQTLVNAERYVTEELKAYESKILGAEDQIISLEQQLFTELIAWMQQYIQPIQWNANQIGQLDCLCAFASLAKAQHYVRPILDDSCVLDIKQGRHPVIEKQLPLGDTYVANDVYLDRESQQILMITGPNMSGKSAILRQTALIVLLAQIGSFVPAKSAKIGIVDKIFTRVGASDNIAMGESTFMVEMNETASILHSISEKSLVLLDEIGRGTSTYDGISIAWAISEFLHEHPYRPKTLFATHYHDLHAMGDQFERIKNYNVSVKELEDRVLFLRKLVKGGSAHSFGIHVAKMAGMPSAVVQKAEKMLKKLEERSNDNSISKKIQELKSEKELQLSFFKLDDPLLEELKEEILSTDIDTLSPIEALMKLNEIKRMLTRKTGQQQV